MITEEQFKELAREIMAHGYDEKTALHFAGLIGDTPLVDADGFVVVMDGNKELARLKLKFFEDGTTGE